MNMNICPEIYYNEWLLACKASVLVCNHYIVLESSTTIDVFEIIDNEMNFDHDYVMNNAVDLNLGAEDSGLVDQVYVKDESAVLEVAIMKVFMSKMLM